MKTMLGKVVASMLETFASTASAAPSTGWRPDSHVDELAKRMGVPAPAAAPWLQMLCEVIEQVPFAMLVVDMGVPGLPIAYCNAAMAKLTGYDKGEIYVTHRMNTNFTGHRHFARSVDGGLTFNETGAHTDLPDPRLHAGLIRCGETRRMTIASSGDSGHSWEIGPSIDENLSRYSDLAATPGGTVLCVYTNGTRRDRDKVSVARLEPS